MKEWKDILLELAKKLTAPFAFVVLLVVVIALQGKNIPDIFIALVYILSIGGLLVYAMLQFLQLRGKYRHDEPKKTPLEQAAPPEAAPQQPQPAPDVFTARESYLRAIVKDCSSVRLAGLDPNASDPNRGGISLEKLYVSLDTTTPKEKPDGKNKQEPELAIRPGKENEPLSALEAWLASDQRRMVLLGLPGTGKSTFVRYLALTMAKAELSRSAELPKGWQGRPLLPFMLSLGRFAETLPANCRKGHAALVENYLLETLKADETTHSFAPLALRVLETEGALVMFDGLDEVAELAKRPLVVQAVEDFVLKHGKNSNNHFLVTCRTYSYRNDADWKLTSWPVYELALLSREKIEYFVNAWYAELTQIEPARKAEFARKRDGLLQHLQPDDRRRLLDIAAFPIILTIMAIVHTHYGDLPDTRAQVYESCVKLLLIHWQDKRPVQGVETQRSILEALDVPESVLLQALWEVAYYAHEGRQAGDGQAALVTEDLLNGKLKIYLKDGAKVETFLKYCESTNGLLMQQGTLATPGRPSRKVYAFPHLTFEEYLAARFLANEEPDEKAYVLAGASDRWRESIKLLGEHLCFGSPQRGTMETWLDALASPPKTASVEEKARMTWLAGEMLALFRRAFPNKTAHSDGTICAQLHEQAIAPLPDPRIRTNCADLADELGYTPDDLHSFVKVDQAFPDEDFAGLTYLARYPVTNAQYKRFLEAEDFHEEKYWTGFPKYAEPEKNYAKMGDWGDEGYQWFKKKLDERKKVLPEYWADARFGEMRPNAPVVGISWWEANAYCKWLLANWDKLEEGKQGLPKPVEIRLPTEAEWELAAGGADGNRFAFGTLKDEKEIVKHANTRESGIGRTTPVWMYPSGESLHKGMDMAGNIWEWQANFLDKDHDWLGLRGGSWYLNVDYARVSYRYYYHPYNRYDNIGVRVLGFFSPP